MFNSLHSSTNQELTSAMKVSTMKNTGDFYYEGKPSCTTTKSTPFTVSKDEWDSKKDSGKYIKNTLYVLRYAKRHVSGSRYVTDPILETNRLLRNYQKWQFQVTKSSLFRQLLTAQKVWAVEERCQFWQVSSCS